MGNTIWPRWNGQNDDRGFEDQLMIFMSHQIVSGTIAEEQYSKEIANYPLRVLKIPHLVTIDDPSAIDEWFKYRPNLKILLMVRDNLKEAALSMKNNGMGTLADDPDEAAKILADRLQAFRDRINGLSIPNEELSHSGFISDAEQGIALLDKFAGLSLTPNEEWLKKFGVTGRTPLEIWQEWFRKEKRTFHKD